MLCVSFCRRKAFEREKEKVTWICRTTFALLALRLLYYAKMTSVGWKTLKAERTV